MKLTRLGRRAAALGLALTVTAGSAFASASEALGWDVHTGQAPLSQGTSLNKNQFWSDTYADLRTEYFVTYTPNAAVLPMVTYGDKILSKATLSSMAQRLEAQGRRVVSGVNGDYFVLATGAPTGLVVSGGVLRATAPYADSLALGFYADGTAFIGAPNLTVEAALPTQTLQVTGGVNRVRKIYSASSGGGLVLFTSDFAAGTQNTEAGVDVVLVPAEGSGGLRIGQSLACTVEQVLESMGSVPLEEGKLVLSLNAGDSPDTLAALRALLPGDTVTVSVTSPDERWNTAVEGLGTLYRMVQDGQVLAGLDTERTARSAVGVQPDGTLIFYTIDGKQPGYSVGATMEQVAKRLVELGCVDAVCLDGGGSTTIGAAFPDGAGMQVVNRPSDGSQRAVSTALFLTTDLQATGVRAGYHVTPSDSVLLSGASVQLSAAAFDTGYFPTGSGSVSWAVSSGGGTVSADGVFTAGAESGWSQVTTGDGAASGTAYLTTVSTPSRITLTNEATGSAVTTLTVSPGQQIDLKASAFYRNLPLTAADTNFQWSVDPAVGAVTPDGVFTAVDQTANGSLTVRAGEKEVVIPVYVAGHIKAIANCEGDLSAFTGTDTIALSAETVLDYVRYGRGSLKLDYDASGGAARCSVGLPIERGETYLSVWVYGDGSGNTLLASVESADGAEHLVTLGTLSFTGWQQLRAALPQDAVALRGLSLIYAGGKQSAGTLWLDHFTTANEAVSDLTPPTVALQVSGGTLTASVADNMDRAFAKAQITVTYDGQPLPFTWSEIGGQAAATLPAADGRAHRVSVTAADQSGNLFRASADISAQGEREPVFADTEGHWAEGFAIYLYDQGVTTGEAGAGGSLFYRPGKYITRAEFFTMTARWLGLDMSQYQNTVLPFTDVDTIPSWALDGIKAMYALGILKGSSAGNGTLQVNALSTITRAEAMTILGRTQARGYAEAEMAFDDADQIPSWALPYMRSLVGQGVVGGYAGRITPMDPITRGEVAKLLCALR